MSRKVLSLNRHWFYRPDFKIEYVQREEPDAVFEEVSLPHSNIELSYNYLNEESYQFVSCYRKKLSFSESYKEKRIFLDFEGVMAYADVFFNGEIAGSHKGGYTPFSVEITDLIRFDLENTLAVRVDSSERNDIPPFGGMIDYLTYGGIYREVFLRSVSGVFIENVFSKAGNVLSEKKGLSISIFLNNDMGLSGEFRLEANLEKNKIILAETSALILLNSKTGRNNNTLELNFENLSGITLWDIENPCLYNLNVILNYNEKEIDSFSTRIGFRQADWRTNGFYLNGNRLKICGLNRHQSYPYVGYAMPERAQKKDADILKYELTLNAVRTSHYPQSRHFLDRCDEIGLLVIEEMPGWQHIGSAEWKENALESISGMIRRDWNHPSIVLWCVRINESKDDHDFYTLTNILAHNLDPAEKNRRGQVY